MSKIRTGFSAGKWLSYAILALILVYAFANTILSVLINHIIEDFRLSGAQEGLMGSLFGFGCMLSLLSTPLLQGRIKKTSMLCISGVTMTIMIFAAGYVKSFPLAMVGYLILGISCGWIDSYSNSCMVDLNGENSTKYLGALHGIYGVGCLLTPLMATTFLLYLQWRQVYSVFALICLAVAVYFIIVVKKTGPQLHSASNIKEYKLTIACMAAYIKNSRNLLLLLAAFFNAVAAAGIAMWSVRYYALQFDAEALGASAISVYWVCGTISRFIAPRLSVHPLRLFIWGSFGAMVTLAIGLISNNAIIMLCMCGLNGLVSAFCVPVLLVEGSKGYEGSTLLPTSMLLMTMGLARALAPVAMGALTIAFSVSFAMYTTAAAGALGGIAALAVLWRQRRTQPL